MKTKKCGCAPGANPDKHPLIERSWSHSDSAGVTEGRALLWPAATNGRSSHGRFVWFDDKQGKEII